ncbi:MAG: hypothetical protein RBU37_13130 [Myxococcota bacterium]|jgi:hypothetical protein|nr:hypothetical protein [Myxococcota bacterium]
MGWQTRASEGRAHTRAPGFLRFFRHFALIACTSLCLLSASPAWTEPGDCSELTRLSNDWQLLHTALVAGLQTPMDATQSEALVAKVLDLSERLSAWAEAQQGSDEARKNAGELLLGLVLSLANTQSDEEVVSAVEAVVVALQGLHAGLCSTEEQP